MGGIKMRWPVCMHVSSMNTFISFYDLPHHQITSERPNHNSVDRGLPYDVIHLCTVLCQAGNSDISLFVIFVAEYMLGRASHTLLTRTSSGTTT